jgi:uncharacterized damage-inducible protein DinB
MARREGLIGQAIADAKRARKTTLATLEGLAPEDLLWRPAPEANPIQWLFWHVAEVYEMVLWTLEARSPSWRFARSALKERGPGGRFPSVEELRAYADDVHAHFLDHLEAMPEAALEQTFGEGVWKGRGAGLIALPPRHETYHCGQMAYVRRLRGKPLPDLNERNPYQ